MLFFYIRFQADEVPQEIRLRDKKAPLSKGAVTLLRTGA